MADWFYGLFLFRIVGMNIGESLFPPTVDLLLIIGGGKLDKLVA